MEQLERVPQAEVAVGPDVEPLRSFGCAGPVLVQTDDTGNTAWAFSIAASRSCTTGAIGALGLVSREMCNDISSLVAASQPSVRDA